MAARKTPSIQVRFWGVRGSLASPGQPTLRTGGNTSCVEVRAGGEVFIFDLGTGVRALGAALLEGGPVHAHVFLSHYHWDHISGLPFFGPAYDARCQLDFYGATRKGKDVRQILSGQMVEPYFPVDIGVFNARLRFVPLQDGGHASIGKVTVRAAELNHPGGALGFRLELGKRSFVYATDFEHGTAADDRLVELSRGADLLVFDAQYLPHEYDDAKKGWGHSTWEQGVQIARTAGVKRLALFHHDPARDDRAVEAIARKARKVHAETFAAREGLTVEL